MSQQNVKADAKSPAMPGSTEQELGIAYGEVKARKTEGDTEQLVFLHKGIVVLGMMKKGRCEELYLGPSENLPRRIELTRDMRDELGEKLYEWTGIDDWQDPALTRSVIGVPVVMSWVSRKGNAMAYVPKAAPHLIYVKALGEPTKAEQAATLENDQDVIEVDAAYDLRNSIGMKF